jgi:hypothetical protein
MVTALRDVAGHRRIGEQGVRVAVEPGAERLLQDQRPETGAVDVEVELQRPAIGGGQALHPFIAADDHIGQLGLDVQHAAFLGQLGQIRDEAGVVQVVGEGQVLHQRHRLAVHLEHRCATGRHQLRLQGETVDGARRFQRADHADRVAVPVERRHESLRLRAPVEVDALLPGRLHVPVQLGRVDLQVVVQEHHHAGGGRLADADDRNGR